jgi:hypothetical protein
MDSFSSAESDEIYVEPDQSLEERSSSQISISQFLDPLEVPWQFVELLVGFENIPIAGEGRII